MKRFLILSAIVLSALWLGNAWGQFGGDETGVPGCGTGAGSIASGAEVPGGCAPDASPLAGAFVPPVNLCPTGAANLSTGCAQPMLGGL